MLRIYIVTSRNKMERKKKQKKKQEGIIYIIYIQNGFDTRCTLPGIV